MAQLGTMHFTKTQFTYWWSRSTDWANGTCWSSFTLRSFGPTLAFSTRLTSCTLRAENQTKWGTENLAEEIEEGYGRKVLWGKCKQNSQGVQQIHWDLQDQAHHVHPRERTKKRWLIRKIFKRVVFWTSCLWHRNNCRNYSYYNLQGYHGHQQDQQDQQDLLLPKRQTKNFDTGKCPNCNQNKNAPVV